MYFWDVFETTFTVGAALLETYNGWKSSPVTSVKTWKPSLCVESRSTLDVSSFHKLTSTSNLSQLARLSVMQILPLWHLWIMSRKKRKNQKTLDSFFRWWNTRSDGNEEEAADIHGSTESTTLAQPWVKEAQQANTPSSVTPLDQEQPVGLGWTLPYSVSKHNSNSCAKNSQGCNTSLHRLTQRLMEFLACRHASQFVFLLPLQIFQCLLIWFADCMKFECPAKGRNRIKSSTS